MEIDNYNQWSMETLNAIARKYMVPVYRDQFNHWSIWSWYNYPQGWPRQFHPFPRIDYTVREYRRIKYRVNAAWNALRGRDDGA